MNDSDFLRLNHLHKNYLEGKQTRTVFHDLNMTVRRGEFVALLGRSGCGKSTLLNLISGIDMPDDGEVIINNQSLTQLNEQARTLFRRRHIGFVFQFFNLIPTLTAVENLHLPLELNAVNNTLAAQRSTDLLARLGLADRAESYPEQLSGGEQQRIAIARALIHEPLLLLADEPTGNLDTTTGHIVMDYLLTLVREQQTTLFMVTHSEEVAAQADRVVILSEGRLKVRENISLT